jgi:hypothetical protein
MNRMIKAACAAAALTVAAAVPAGAAVTFDPATGTGFVGKGDVQFALGLNNAQLQNGGPYVFTYSAVTEQETSWVCLNERNGNQQERERTTTSTTTGVASSIERVRNQITGFNLAGFQGTPSVTATTEGPPLNSCPNANSSYVLGSTVIGDPTVISGGLSVNGTPLQ